MNRHLLTLGGFFIAMTASVTLAMEPPWPPALALNSQQQATLGIRVSGVERVTTTSVLASAQVSLPPGREVVVAAPYAGTLTRIVVGTGDSVAAQAPLAWMSSAVVSEARRQWREAQLDADHWRATLQREQALLEEGLIPRARFDLTANRTRNAETALAARAAELQATGLSPTQLQQATDFTSAAVRTPQAGSVVESSALVGQRVEAGTPLFRVADTRELQLDIQLSVDKARQVRTGDSVVINQRQAAGVIVGVSRSTDASQLVRARAKVTQAGNLSVGEWVPVHIQSPLRTSKGWRLPVQALVQHPTTPLVFVATDSGFQPVPVRVLSNDDDRVVVEAALQSTSRVAITGVAALRALLQREQ